MRYYELDAHMSDLGRSVYKTRIPFLTFGSNVYFDLAFSSRATRDKNSTTTPKHLLFSRFWVTTGWYSYQQQPGRTPVCQASLTTTKSSEYSNSTAVGFEPVRRHFVALQTPVSSYVASRDRQHDPAQRSANKATCSTERTA